MNNPKTYSKWHHTEAVLRESKAQDGARTLLLYVTRYSSTKGPFVTVTKDQVCENCGMCRNTARAAFRFLASEGSLVGTHNTAGGRNTATTYSLRIAGQGERIEYAGEFKGDTPQQERDKYWRAMARKHGGKVASDMADKKFGKTK